MLLNQNVSSHILPHHFDHFVVHLLWGIQTPDEVQVLPVFNVMVVHQFGYLCQQQSYVLRICQSVLPTRPQGCGYRHVPHVVQGRGRLIMEKQEEILTLQALLSSTTDSQSDSKHDTFILTRVYSISKMPWIGKLVQLVVKLA